MKLTNIVDEFLERHKRFDSPGTYIIRCIFGCAALFGGGFLAGVVLTCVFTALTRWLGI